MRKGLNQLFSQLLAVVLYRCKKKEVSERKNKFKLS